MLTSAIRIVIPGHPKPKGSLKCIGGRGGRGHVLIEDNKGTKAWRTTFAGWCRQKVTQQADKGQPIGVSITFTLDRPKSHHGTGRNATTLRAGALPLPVGHATGDLDKLVRLILDALQDAGVLPDDCQVVELKARKVYPRRKTSDDDPWDLASQALPYPGVEALVYPIEVARP